jgi:hypothetical protein
MIETVGASVSKNSIRQSEYLGLIQATISRMAGNSAIMKGFAATLIAAMLGMSVAESVEWYYLLIAIIPLLAFIRLDVFYLQLERKYRNLYTLIAEKQVDCPHFVLDLKSPILKDHQESINQNAGFWKTLCSVSVWQFYIWFIALAVVLMIFIA